MQNKHTGSNNELQHGESNKENQDSNQRYLEQSSRKGRKRVRNESEWKRNIAKRRRNEGKSYLAKSGKTIKARVMRKTCGHKCKFSCNIKFSEESREKIFHKSVAMGSLLCKDNF